jgi:hypothetical protein
MSVMRARLLRSCHSTSAASRPVPRGHIIIPAVRVERRPLRHLRGARSRSVRPLPCSPTPNLPIYRHHACASPVRALRASAGSSLASLFGRVFVPPASDARSTRRGTPRPCCSAMPRAGVSSIPPGLVASSPLGDTARVRRPTLTTLPSAMHPRAQFTLPTAPKDRSRPHNPACSGLRGAARRSPLTHVG